MRYYRQLGLLQPAEAAVLNRFAAQWPTFKVLDIGVGGGRTTAHFAPQAAQYTGIDYCAEMIAACQSRFAKTLPPNCFELCDVRDLSRFADNAFDFILFSFNGIDYMSHRERQALLPEICRIGKPGGYFCFSSHNLQGLEQAFDLKRQLRLNPLSSYVNLIMLALLRWLNRPLTLTALQAADHVIVKDESHNFRLRTYYVRPKAQLEQLAAFGPVDVYSWKSDLPIATAAALAANVDAWLYYLCSIK